MSVGTYEVRYREADGMWIVIGTNASRASKKLKDKKSAVRVAKRLANQNGESIRVYTRDGRHQQSHRYDMTDRATKRCGN